MRTFRQLPELVDYAYNEMREVNDQRIYFDPYPALFDFDKDEEENPPSYYVADTMKDDGNVPNSALLLSRGPLKFLFLIESLLVQYYKSEKPKLANGQN